MGSLSLLSSRVGPNDEVLDGGDRGGGRGVGEPLIGSILRGMRAMMGQWSESSDV
jgi:hypothetical protein